MVAYNFQKQFAEPVADGVKKQTIRANRKNGHAKPGQALQLYTGMRTKSCKKLRDVVCVDVQEIRIGYNGVMLGGVAMSGKDVGELARADGFHSVSEFRDFFRAQYGLPFHGVLIRWETKF